MPKTPVTVLGLGSMGAALAGAFLSAGHPTTVWNRTASKADPLVARGARRAGTIEDAVRASPLIIACLTTYEDTRAVLEPATLTGHALVTLNSGSPAGARRMAEWATGRGARFLDGAVKNIPSAVGAPDTLLYYGGDKAVFDEHGDTLRVLGGDTVHLGEETDLAALYEMAVGGTLLPALVGFFQGAAALRSRGLEAGTLLPYATKWFEMIISALPMYAKEIDSRDYSAPAASVDIFHAGAVADLELAEEGVDVAWQRPLHDLVRRAAEAGHGDQSIAILTELLSVEVAGSSTTAKRP
ncbi:NAD(P)-dependent oxidoreductase [Amycolatopsis umgeniensis]|uniref:3-hydroxyisobutyrate dehydrogenase-like beta-hydroxyacid dehydrogenase n=1 Tax=Amycolatopsis umgeniensis TaxID=336628 RepID=A0A841BBB3_9PSEU|nr:NAD(P)-binding domain-containing protein [Amycolatopsis umgeniensis]MBB5856143.1 3-hydroxyisobutyrate dehydrogenase-like beta-hydroxyacid dehydrogenase [Amycolatopsis umgeniensis]